MTAVIQTGALKQLPALLDQRGLRRIFLVTGGDGYRRSGAADIIDHLVADRITGEFSGVRENPDIEQLEAALQRFNAATADCIVAIGGGSVMDMAKLIAIVAEQEAAPRNCVGEGLSLKPAKTPIVAVPTTAGSGSQATHYAVLYIAKVKHSVAHPSMRPSIALVDPDLLRSVPPAITAAAGLDALNQGIESMWAVRSTDASQQHASVAISLAWNHLRIAVTAADDESRLAMATAAHRAGEAIDVTKTTAPHAISYPITSHFGVAHGHACGLVFAEVMRFNARVTANDCLDPRGTSHVIDVMNDLLELLGEPDIDTAARAYNDLMDDIGLTRDLSALGIADQTDREIIVQNGFNPDRMSNNPRRFTERDLRQLLERCGTEPTR